MPGDRFEWEEFELADCFGIFWDRFGRDCNRAYRYVRLITECPQHPHRSDSPHEWKIASLNDE